MAIKKIKKLSKVLSKNFISKGNSDNANVKKVSAKPKREQLIKKRKIKVDSDQDDFDECAMSFQENATKAVKKRKLEVASDQELSDDQGDELSKVQSGQIVVTPKMVKKWEKLVHKNIHEAIKELGEAFKAVVQANESNEEKKDVPSRYFVKATNVSDAIISACIVELIPSVIEHLNLSDMKSGDKVVLPSTSSKWKKIKNLIKPYLLDLLKLLDQMTNTELLATLMKHTFQVTPMFVCFPKIIKPFIKKLVEFWGSSSDTVRILCFKCLYVVILNVSDKIAKHLFLSLYVTAMKSSGFTTINSLPAINYMKTSLVDLYCMKPTVAYECVFRSLQQVSMYLLGVINQNKKTERLINWRFCHSLSIFADFIGKRKDDENTSKLIHTVSDIIIGTINFYQSPSYIPMWLFCARILIQLMEDTGLYIPVLPIILKPLETTLFDATPKEKSMKSCVFSVCLKMSKEELKEKAFQDEVIDEIFELLIMYASSLAHKITFPEIVLKDMITLKNYIKKSKAPIYIKKFKEAIDKIQKRCSEMKTLRNAKKVDIRDLQSISELEDKWKQEGCELKNFCNCWIKTRLRILELQSSNKDQICTDDLPTIKRPEPKKATEEDKKNFEALFKFGDDEDDDDNDDEGDDEEYNADVARFQPKDDKPVKKSSKVKKPKAEKAKTVQDQDSCSDFDEDELELLARSSASSGEDDDDDNLDESGAGGEDESDADNEDESDADDEDESGNDKPDVVKDLNFEDDDEDNDDKSLDDEPMECDDDDDL